MILLLSFAGLCNAAEPFLLFAFAVIALWLLVMMCALRTGNAASKWEAFRREAQASEYPHGDATKRDGKG